MSAHAQDARNDALRIKSLQRIIFFAQATNLRRPGNFRDRKRRAAASVTVQLGQNHAVSPSRCELSAERTASDLSSASAIKRISAGCNSFFSVLSSSSTHRRCASVPGVHQDHIASRKFGLFDRPRTNLHRLICATPGHTCVPIAFATCASCSRAAGRYTSVETHNRPMPVLRQPFRQLAGRSRLPEPCNPTIIHTEGRPRRQTAAGMLAQHRGQFVAHALNHLLVRRSLQASPRCNRLLADVGEQFRPRTPTFTSPSSSASRISAAASRLAPRSFPCPRKFLNVLAGFFPSNSQNISAFPARNLHCIGTRTLTRRLSPGTFARCCIILRSRIRDYQSSQKRWSRSRNFATIA